jgi:ABC-type phosphate transport system substrate-binding protein
LGEYQEASYFRQNYSGWAAGLWWVLQEIGIHSNLAHQLVKLFEWQYISTETAMNSRLLWLALVLVLLQVAAHAEESRVELRARANPKLDAFLNYAKNGVLKSTNDRINMVTQPSSSYEDDKAALLAGDVDFVVTPRPITDAPGDVPLMHFPIATGGFVIVANTVKDHQTKMKAQHLASIFSGSITVWNHDLFKINNPEFSTVTYPIQVVVWDDSGYATTELKRYLENNSEGTWQSTTTFPANTIRKSTYAEALEYVKTMPGAITYVPFTDSGTFFPFSIYIPQSDDFVSPGLNNFKNALMPLKEPEHLPSAEETSKWAAFTLTDMKKMPPDGSCMSMPPYPLSHFQYLVIKQDQTTSPALHGAAVAAFIRLLVSPDIQSHAPSSKIATMAPTAALTANVRSLRKIIFRSGESLDTFLVNVPIAESVPETMPNMPGDMKPGSGGMGDMEPASTAAVVTMIVFLLLSGVISVAAYVAVLKIWYGGSFYDHATWVPWAINRAAPSPPQQRSSVAHKYESLRNSTELVASV